MLRNLDPVEVISVLPFSFGIQIPRISQGPHGKKQEGIEIRVKSVIRQPWRLSRDGLSLVIRELEYIYGYIFTS